MGSVAEGAGPRWHPQPRGRPTGLQVVRCLVRATAWALWLSGAASFLQAEDGWEGHVLTLNFDNDLTARLDRHYTSGVRLSYLSADDWGPGWLARLGEALPSWGFESAAQKWGLEIGQHIYTPEDLHRPDLQVHDRPYAGWLYVSPALQRRGPAHGRLLLMETVRLDLGLTGPPSLAEQAQDWAHRTDPSGWSHQLKTELAFALRYQRRYRVAWRAPGQGWGVDLLPQTFVNLGTLEVSAGAGATVRAGYQIPNEFAPGLSRRRWGAYVFAGLNGRWVGHNLFLDGNTFRSSHRVDRQPACGQFQAGLALVLKSVELAAAHTYLSPEFEGQPEWDQFSSIFLTVKF